MVNPNATLYPLCPRVHQELLHRIWFSYELLITVPQNLCWNSKTLSHCWFILRTRNLPNISYKKNIQLKNSSVSHDREEYIWTKITAFSRTNFILIGNSIPLYEISVDIFRLMWKILKNHYIVILRVSHWLIPILLITSISYASGYASI